MPRHMRLIARYGNGASACFFAGLVLYALGHGAVFFALFWVLVCGLAAFNFFMFEKVSDQSSDREQSYVEADTLDIHTEVMGHSPVTPESVVRNHGL